MSLLGDTTMADYRTLSIRLPETLAERLATAAHLMGSTQANVVRSILDHGLMDLQASEWFLNKIKDQQEVLAEMATRKAVLPEYETKEGPPFWTTDVC